MAAIDEANIQTTIMLLKRQAETKGIVPVAVTISAHDPEYAWRYLAMRYLSEREQAKQKRETLVVETPTLS